MLTLGDDACERLDDLSKRRTCWKNYHSVMQENNWSGIQLVTLFSNICIPSTRFVEEQPRRTTQIERYQRLVV